MIYILIDLVLEKPQQLKPTQKNSNENKVWFLQKAADIKNILFPNKDKYGQDETLGKSGCYLMSILNGLKSKGIEQSNGKRFPQNAEQLKQFVDDYGKDIFTENNLINPKGWQKQFGIEIKRYDIKNADLNQIEKIANSPNQIMILEQKVKGGSHFILLERVKDGKAILINPGTQHLTKCKSEIPFTKEGFKTKNIIGARTITFENNDQQQQNNEQKDDDQDLDAKGDGQSSDDNDQQSDDKIIKQRILKTAKYLIIHYGISMLKEMGLNYFSGEYQDPFGNFDSYQVKKDISSKLKQIIVELTFGKFQQNKLQPEKEIKIDVYYNRTVKRYTFSQNNNNKIKELKNKIQTEINLLDFDIFYEGKSLECSDEKLIQQVFKEEYTIIFVKEKISNHNNKYIYADLVVQPGILQESIKNIKIFEEQLQNILKYIDQEKEFYKLCQDEVLFFTIINHLDILKDQIYDYLINCLLMFEKEETQPKLIISQNYTTEQFEKIKFKLIDEITKKYVKIRSIQLKLINADSLHCQNIKRKLKPQDKLKKIDNIKMNYDFKTVDRNQNISGNLVQNKMLNAYATGINKTYNIQAQLIQNNMLNADATAIECSDTLQVQLLQTNVGNAGLTGIDISSNQSAKLMEFNFLNAQFKVYDDSINQEVVGLKVSCGNITGTLFKAPKFRDVSINGAQIGSFNIDLSPPSLNFSGFFKKLFKLNLGFNFSLGNDDGGGGGGGNENQGQQNKGGNSKSEGKIKKNFISRPSETNSKEQIEKYRKNDISNFNQKFEEEQQQINKQQGKNQQLINVGNLHSNDFGITNLQQKTSNHENNNGGISGGRSENKGTQNKGNNCVLDRKSQKNINSRLSDKNCYKNSYDQQLENQDKSQFYQYENQQQQQQNQSELAAIFKQADVIEYNNIGVHGLDNKSEQEGKKVLEGEGGNIIQKIKRDNEGIQVTNYNEQFSEQMKMKYQQNQLSQEKANQLNQKQEENKQNVKVSQKQDEEEKCNCGGSKKVCVKVGNIMSYKETGHEDYCNTQKNKKENSKTIKKINGNLYGF